MAPKYHQLKKLLDSFVEEVRVRSNNKWIKRGGGVDLKHKLILCGWSVSLHIQLIKKKGNLLPLRKQLFRLQPQREQAIINVSDFPEVIWNLFTLKKCCLTHHRGLIRFRISDRKFVNHTTEMILWSMILVDACMIFVHTEGNVENVLKVEAMVKSRRLSRFGWRTKENSFYSSISNLFLSSCFKVKIISLHCI